MPSLFRILLVDDDPELLNVVTWAAQDSFPEARFTQVANASKAIAYFATLQGYGPKLMLLDINLNDLLTGFDLLAMLRANERTALLPVVMLTVSQSTVDIEFAYKHGANSFMVKPFTPNEWKLHLSVLRGYWYQTVTLPTIRYSAPN